MEDPGDVAFYAQAFAVAWSAALRGDEAVRLIRATS